MARKRHEEEHENHERWLVSYADFITLLFAFFVVMYSVSRIDNKRMSQAVSSIKWAMHFSGTGGVAQMPIFDGPAADTMNVVDLGGTGPQAPPSAVSPEAARDRLEKRLRPFLMQRSGPAAVAVTVEGRAVTVRLTAAAFFDPAQAALRPDVLPILDAIADELVPLERLVRVEGHTDDSPVVSGRYHDNWELSAARAATVASYLERAHHARPELLVASGFGASRPIAEGTTPQARETNRRIELVAEFGMEESRRR